MNIHWDGGADILFKQELKLHLRRILDGDLYEDKFGSKGYLDDHLEDDEEEALGAAFR